MLDYKISGEPKENPFIVKKEDIGMKCNGLSSATKFEVFDLGSGVKQEWHEHPDTGELVVVNTWYVPNGEDDVDHDFEVIKVYPSVGCQLAKYNVGHNINKPIL